MSITTATGSVPSADKPIMSQRQILLVIIGLMAGMFLSSLDQTIVGTAIRTIGDDLHGLDQQAWVTTAYLITSTITTPLYGKLSDIFGRRGLFILAIGVFIVGSIMASFSTSMLMLAGFRAVQGIGAGGLMALPLAIMGDILAPRERAKYQGFFLAVFGVSTVIGPLVGGLFAGTNEILWISGWRWVFLINVPIGIIALILVIAFLHLPRFHGHSVRIDWWGAATIIIGLVPLLLVAEQGREWGWTSPGAFACYLIGALGIAAFIVVETRMGDDALIPFRLFKSGVFSMATIIGVLVGFGMFGAMMTLPLYTQIVFGLTPTESGYALLPMVLGMMISSIATGQIVSRSGKYRYFPVSGAAFMAAGFIWLTFLTVDSSLWFLMGGIFLLGMGLGQLMQTLILASQNAVEPKDMGVASSSATFFRQMGGTVGTAVLLSVLFSVLPGNFSTEMQNKQDLTSALDAALDPAVASAPQNAGVMQKIWSPITSQLTGQVQAQLDDATQQVTQQVTDTVTQQVTQAVDAQVSAGAVPAAAAQTIIDQQVQQLLPGALQQGLQAAAQQANASVVDGKLSIDLSNPQERQALVDQAVPQISDAIAQNGAGGEGASADTSDTSFLIGADARLSRPFLSAFSMSSVLLYWIGFIVLLITFVLTWFFRPPTLRKVSALQARADEAAAAAALGESGTMTVDADTLQAAAGEDAEPAEGEPALARGNRAAGAAGDASTTKAPDPES